MVFQGKAYNETRIGDHISAALTITETHLVLAGVCHNQEGEVVSEADGKIPVKNSG